MGSHTHADVKPVDWSRYRQFAGRLLVYYASFATALVAPLYAQDADFVSRVAMDALAIFTLLYWWIDTGKIEAGIAMSFLTALSYVYLWPQIPQLPDITFGMIGGALGQIMVLWAMIHDAYYRK